MYWTYQDAVEQILDLNGLDPTWQNVRNGRRAVLEAYRDLPTYHGWHYLKKAWVLNSEPCLQDGMITYTQSTQQLTLTSTDGAIWPANSIYGYIWINGVTYRIIQRTSDTVLTLDPNSNPGADITTPTAYIWFRSCYPLPNDYRRHGRMFESSTKRELTFGENDDLHASYFSLFSKPTTSWEFTVRGSEQTIGGMVLELNPPPDTLRGYVFLYQRQPRDLLTYSYSTGTVSSSSTTITGIGTAFTAAMVGCVMRFGDSGNLPSGPIGISQTGIDPVAEVRVTAVSSSTVLTVDTAIATLSGVKFTISDPLEVEYASMLSPLFRLSEFKFAENNKREGQNSRWTAFMRQLDVGRDADRRSTAIVSVKDAQQAYSLLGDTTVR